MSDQLAEIRRQLERVRDRIVQAIAVDGFDQRAPGARLLRDLRAFDALFSEQTALEVRLVARDMLTTWQRDRALKAAAAIQEHAGQKIVKQVMEAGDRLRARARGNPDAEGYGNALKGAIRNEFDTIAEVLEDQGRKAAVGMALEAGLHSRALAGAALGAQSVLRSSAELGLSWGGGLPLGFVDDIWREWGARPAYLLRSGGKDLAMAAQAMVVRGRDARKAFEELRGAGFPPAALTKWAERLRNSAREAVAVGGRDAGLAFRVAAARASLLAGRLKQTGRLGMRGVNKKLIADLRSAVRLSDRVAIDRAIDRYLTRRAAYQATLAMRTLTNEAYREAAKQEAIRSPWVYAQRRVLSIEHPVFDYCDGVAMADPLGLGPGIWPIGELPEEHPAGLCRDEPVIDDGFIREGMEPLTFTVPPNIDDLRRRFGHKGDIARALNKIGQQGGGRKEIKNALRLAGVQRNGPVDLVRGRLPVAVSAAGSFQDRSPPPLDSASSGPPDLDLIRGRPGREGDVVAPPTVALPTLGGLDSETQRELASHAIVSRHAVDGDHVNGVWRATLDDGTLGALKLESEERSSLRRWIDGPLWRREVAARDVAELVGYDDLVPVTATVKYHGEDGSLMAWVVDGAHEPFHGRPLLHAAPESDKQRAALFDYAIGNADRHGRNYMVTPDGRLHLIDHGYILPSRNDEARSVITGDVVGRLRATRIPGSLVEPWVKAAGAIEERLRARGFSDEEIGGILSRIKHLKGRPRWDSLEY